MYLERFKIKNKIAIITGGTRGIGRGICEILKRAGATVIAGYASDDEPRSTRPYHEPKRLLEPMA